MSDSDIHLLLSRIQEILSQHTGDSADWVAEVAQLYGSDPAAGLRRLNSKRMWGGAGSIANEALADNPGMDDYQWQMQIRELRELLIELGNRLQSLGQSYPDISSWMMAFNNWNQSEV